MSKRKRRKSDKCLNCEHPLELSYDYCPSCGQENDDRQLSFGSLVHEFFSNYFSLDSRFGRSIVPFFFKPGVLTRAFMEGKRMMYANPVRLYLVVSLIHFFLISLNMSQNDLPQGKLIQQDGSEKDSTDLKAINIDATDSDMILFSNNEWSVIRDMTQDSQHNFTVKQIEDSIHNETKKAIPRYLTRQFIKLLKSDISSISAYVIGKVPTVMFFLLPFYALLLKIFFSRKLYISHLVHSVHLHSFAMVMLSLVWFTNLFSNGLSNILNTLVMLAIPIYIVFSFKNTYQVKLSTAIYKMFLTSMFYCVIFGIGLMMGILISLLFY